MSRRIELVSHDPAWARLAAEEAGLVALALGPSLLRIEHVGSTAIPGLLSKPTIDLMPVVTTLAAADARQSTMIALGYDSRGECGLEGRRFFCRDAADGMRLFNVHCWAEGHPALARHLAFRDYLRGHPEEAFAYESEKQRALSAAGNDSALYQREKAAWVDACQARALAWVARTS